MKRGVIVVVGLIFLIIIVVLIVAAARSNNAPTATATTLTIWSPFDEAKVYDQISESFLKSNPNTQISFKYIQAKDAKDYEAKVVNAIADGSGPDIWLVRNDWITKHVDKSLPAFAEKEGSDPIAIFKEVMFDRVVDANAYDGKLYGLPLFGDSLAIIYNADYYDRYFDQANAEQQTAISNPAQTWQQLKTQVAGVSRSSGATVTRSGMATGTSDNSFAPADVLGALLAQNGSTILTADRKNIALNLAIYVNGQPTFPTTDALAAYTSFATPGQPNYSWSTTMGDPVEAFASQKTGAIIGYYSTLQDIIKRKVGFTIRVGPLPQKNEDVKERVDYGITWSHLVNKNSPYGGLAWSYLSSLLGEDNPEVYAKATNHLSVADFSSPTELDADIVNLEDAAKLFEVQLQTIAKLEKPEWQGIDEIFQDMIKQVVNLHQSAQNSVDSAAERLKVYLPTN